MHILQSVPPPPSSPLSLQGAGKLAGHVHRIPVVVQSLPLMYTTAVRSPSSLNNAIMLPLLEEAKSQGKGEGIALRYIYEDDFVLFGVWEKNEFAVILLQLYNQRAHKRKRECSFFCPTT